MAPRPYCKVCLLVVGFPIEKSGDISERGLFVMGATRIRGAMTLFQAAPSCRQTGSGTGREESWVASPEFIENEVPTSRTDLTKSSSPSPVGWLSWSGRGDADVLSLCKHNRKQDVGDRQSEEPDGEKEK